MRELRLERLPSMKVRDVAMRFYLDGSGIGCWILVENFAKYKKLKIFIYVYHYFFIRHPDKLNKSSFIKGTDVFCLK